MAPVVCSIFFLDYDASLVTYINRGRPGDFSWEGHALIRFDWRPGGDSKRIACTHRIEQQPLAINCLDGEWAYCCNQEGTRCLIVN